ncbi:hypothetical protein ACQP00_10755 [Dactylosporangium sp. CS-047395]|uniref:hypothetical protein n=1 Tax=Dactylosporangium sp. CS-047395 TaxID=3239936 RepID=UPI003D8DD542
MPNQVDPPFALVSATAAIATPAPVIAVAGVPAFQARSRNASAATVTRARPAAAPASGVPAESCCAAAAPRTGRLSNATVAAASPGPRVEARNATAAATSPSTAYAASVTTGDTSPATARCTATNGIAAGATRDGKAARIASATASNRQASAGSAPLPIAPGVANATSARVTTRIARVGTDPLQWRVRSQTAAARRTRAAGSCQPKRGRPAAGGVAFQKGRACTAVRAAARPANAA